MPTFSAFLDHIPFPQEPAKKQPKEKIVAKVGRNDPCSCGSGKKFKKCCAGKEASNGIISQLKKQEFFDPRAIADKWMGKDTVKEEKTFGLVIDQYSYLEASALRQVKALGKVSEETVLFYQGKQWIGEVDFSVPGEIILTTADLKMADKLGQKILALGGFTHKSRHEDSFEALDEQQKIKVAEGMRDFKVRFFKTWLDEANERLEGTTPRQASLDPKLKLELKALIHELEQREDKLPKKERFSFKEIRKELGL